MVDKDFCLSSYMAFRYVWKKEVNFAEGLTHELFCPIAETERTKVASAEEIDSEIQKQFDKLYEKYRNIGILLSGGMDSAILAAYLKKGSHAYTFTASGTQVFDKDVERAAAYCNKYGLNHHLVEIDFEDYKSFTPIVTKRKGAPVHSIEPQIYKAATMAKADGVELIIVGESADLIFGGMDQLLSKDWRFDEFVKRYTFLEPDKVLTTPTDTNELFEKYRKGEYKMKKYLLFLAVFMVILSLVSCSFEPIVTTYGDSVHEAVKEHYETYEILGLVRLEKDDKPTLQNFCIINDMQGKMDILCIAYALSEENKDAEDVNKEK